MQAGTIKKTPGTSLEIKCGSGHGWDKKKGKKKLCGKSGKSVE